MEKFQSKIMVIGEGKIEEVEKIVDEKVAAMKPSSHLGISSAARVSEGGITGPS